MVGVALFTIALAVNLSRGDGHAAIPRGAALGMRSGEAHSERVGSPEAIVAVGRGGRGGLALRCATYAILLAAGFVFADIVWKGAPVVPASDATVRESSVS